VKRLEADIIRLEERTKSIREDQRRLDGVTFEETGVDYVFIDEAHLFKNLSFPTRTSSASATAVGWPPSPRPPSCPTRSPSCT
jgi:N12 class adenine-specific DNA methylase